MAHDSHGAPSSHEHQDPPEDPLRSPDWLPLLGLGLALAGALAVYLFVAPGVLRPSNTDPESATDGGAAAQEPAAPADAAPEGAH
jgi:hypothetical protein